MSPDALAWQRLGHTHRPSRLFSPTSRPRTRSLKRVSASSLESGDVLSWLVEHRYAEPGKLRIEIQERGGQGRGLVSLGNEPNEVLLSLPYDTVFMDTETDESSHLPWNGRMAMRLLRQKHACERGDARDACMCPWIASLPQHVDLPMFYASVAELEACEDANLITEALSIRESAEGVYESERGELDRMGYQYSDLQWALSVLHSRCFTMGSPALHLTAPGIDMANHTFTPNATVRIRHSPGAVQGRGALEEICDPPEPEPSRLELLALDAGIRRGSYHQLWQLEQ